MKIYDNKLLYSPLKDQDQPNKNIFTLLKDDTFSIKNTWFETRLQIYLDRVVQFNNTSFKQIGIYDNFKLVFDEFKQIFNTKFSVPSENRLKMSIESNQNFINFITQQNSSTVPGIIRDIESFYGKNICRNNKDFIELLNMKTWASYYSEDENNIWNGDYVIDQAYPYAKYKIEDPSPNGLLKNM